MSGAPQFVPWNYKAANPKLRPQDKYEQPDTR
jgi:hypothetical protein